MNQIEIDDIKLKIGELVIENLLLQKELARIRAELEKLMKTEKARSKLVHDNFPD